MTHELDPPPGWRFSAFPGWSLDDPENQAFLPELVQIGHVLLPEYFYLAAGTPGMWPTEKNPYPGGDDFAVFLHFQARHGELRLREIRGAGEDLISALDAFRKAVPSKLWRPIAIREITELLAIISESGGWPVDSWKPIGTDEWVKTLGERRAKDLHPAFRPKRRNRITDEHLQAVAEEYLAADNLGLPPTKAVAEHFKTSHSTAAKWVGAARRRNFLPPVNKMNVSQRERRLEAELKDVEAVLEGQMDPSTRAELELNAEGIKRDLEQIRKDASGD